MTTKKSCIVVAALLIIALPILSLAFRTEELLSVERRFHVGQERFNFYVATNIEHYETLQVDSEVPEDALFLQRGDEDGLTRLLRVQYSSSDQVKTISGRSVSLKVGENTLLPMESGLDDARRLLGEPTWIRLKKGEEIVYFQQHRLYLSFQNDKLVGLSLSEGTETQQWCDSEYWSSICRQEAFENK